MEVDYEPARREIERQWNGKSTMCGWRAELSEDVPGWAIMHAQPAEDWEQHPLTMEYLVRIRDGATVLYFKHFHPNNWPTVSEVIRDADNAATAQSITFELDRRLREHTSRERAAALALRERERWDAYVQYRRQLAEVRAQRRQRWKQRRQRLMFWNRV